MLRCLFVELLINREEKYPANLAGAPGALIFFCIFSCIKVRAAAAAGEVFPVTFRIHPYPANLAGAPGALIFFCFFSSIKGRKDDPKA